MEKSLIQKLQKAGVSADVILALVLDDDQPAEGAQAPAGDSAQSAADPQGGAQTPEVPAQPAQPAGGTDPILAAINKLTGAIQASNIINSGAAGRPQAVTVDDVMAKIIQPTAPGKK